MATPPCRRASAPLPRLSHPRAGARRSATSRRVAPEAQAGSAAGVGCSLRPGALHSCAKPTRFLPSCQTQSLCLPAPHGPGALQGHCPFLFRCAESAKDCFAGLSKAHLTCVAVKDAALTALGKRRRESPHVPTVPVAIGRIGARLAPILGSSHRPILQ